MAEPGTIGPPLGAATRPDEPAWTTRLSMPSGTCLDLDPAGGTHRLAGAAAAGEVAEAGLQLVGGQVGQDELAALGRARDQPAALGLAGAEVDARGGLVAVPGDPQGGHEGGPVDRADLDGERPLDVEGGDGQLGGAAAGDRLAELPGRKVALEVVTCTSTWSGVGLGLVTSTWAWRPPPLSPPANDQAGLAAPWAGRRVGVLPPLLTAAPATTRPARATTSIDGLSPAGASSPRVRTTASPGWT